MVYFRTFRNPGHWDECQTCDSGPGERCRHLIRSTMMATVHEGRRKLGQAEFETAKADYERRQQERRERLIRNRREAQIRLDNSIEKHGYIKPNVNMALSLDDPPQPAEKPPGARLVKQTVHQDWRRDEVILENEYTYQAYKPVWDGWIRYGTTTSASINTTPIQYTIQDNTWREWTAIQRQWITGATITATGGYVWPRWIEMGHAAENAAGAIRQMGQTAEQMSEEMRLLRQRQEDARQARREAENRERLAREKRQKGARERASELLDMVLSDAEKAYMDDHHGRILVRSQHGHLYEIDTRYGGVHGNITRVDEHGCILGRLCVAPRMYDGHQALPLEDGYVGQYLALRFNEDDLLAKANWSGRRECQNPGVPILGQQRVA